MGDFSVAQFAERLEMHRKGPGNSFKHLKDNLEKKLNRLENLAFYRAGLVKKKKVISEVMSEDLRKWK